ncbi:MAG: tRNA 2-thiouridine(34) synthase MnmA [Methylobacterium sp.]|nr:tRNA 2-thiouridine(34) synthase MnmA [Methylobacterium sp.]MCA3607860.1 tRNA 2-thiouridine(34) synthase MnmA [Methylobacterium sp.]MCA3610002.1 tRNA 2-thiouridine(34) synthase MnmA [Methylobacterium sp.]MCA3617640.1 tRNA 2-thiouridine(34) synthase MnmA [Methylobacterium sp.]MCA3620259.1 tRNA 2-thiouridine(34) synthase MnmA [Methylobacterium sp.]
MTLNGLDIAKPAEKTRVVVAMSGGIDSSVVAALLARAGHEVIGITLQLYDHGAATHRPGSCCAGRDIQDARNVARQLGIPHYVLDYESRFREDVIESFADSYARGETPIPCVECNRTVKFRDLLAFAEELDADCLATGHYVESRALAGGGRGLFRPIDLDRDQSYFLFATTKPQLARLRFPLAGMTKAETRAIAREIGLSNADKADSQDICFVPSGNYAELVRKLKPEADRPGAIRHLDGRVLGQHAGTFRYTIGQRRGLGIAAREPLYVIRVDADRSEVIVGPREALALHEFPLRDVNWLGDTPIPSEGFAIHARVRSTRAPKPAMLRQDGRGIVVEIFEGEEGVAPGQACVFYDGDGAGARVLGGGTIMRQLERRSSVVPTEEAVSALS